jgi:hypothetical protein
MFACLRFGSRRARIGVGTDLPKGWYLDIGNIQTGRRSGFCSVVMIFRRRDSVVFAMRDLVMVSASLISLMYSSMHLQQGRFRVKFIHKIRYPQV